MNLMRSFRILFENKDSDRGKLYNKIGVRKKRNTYLKKDECPKSKELGIPNWETLGKVMFAYITLLTTLLPFILTARKPSSLITLT